MSAALLAVESVEVLGDAVRARVRCDPLRMRTRDVPGVAEAAIAALPGLVRHACDNDAGLPMAEELADTEVAHLFEHVAVELLRLSAPHRANRGETAWDFARDGRGVFEVTLRHPDDLACVAALRGAGELLTEWEAGCGGDTDAAVARVRDAGAR